MFISRARFFQPILLPRNTYSYAGNFPWAGLADYVDSVFTITDGHLLIELNARKKVRKIGTKLQMTIHLL